MEPAKANQVKTSLSLSDPFVVQVFRDNLHKVTSDGIDLLFCNSHEAKSFTNTQSTAAATKQLKNYAKPLLLLVVRVVHCHTTVKHYYKLMQLGLTQRILMVQAICLWVHFCMQLTQVITMHGLLSLQMQPQPK